MEIENLSKQSGTTNVSINNRIQEIEERILGLEDMIEETDTSDKEKC